MFRLIRKAERVAMVGCLYVMAAAVFALFIVAVFEPVICMLFDVCLWRHK